MKEESKGNNFPLNPYRSDPEQGGTQRTLLDIAGQLFYAWDTEDRRTEMIYDELRRPLMKITDTKELEVYVYGEGLVNDKINNLRGQLYQHYDGSGLQQMNSYDFKGNALETQQQLLEDATISDADWNSNPVLSAEIFTSAITFDALNRAITQTDPSGNVQAFTYDKGGVLKKVKLNTDEYVNDIHYDAKGQRQAIWYGNGTKTSYTYDAFTFRLRRLLTVNLNNNDILQDLNYWYDPVGNITEIQDDAQQTLFFNNSVVAPTQKFVYDAIYRLSEAKGRELIGTADFGGADNWNDATWKTNHKGDGSAVQNYTQKYSYDEVGNILQLLHIAGAGSYTRIYEIDSNSNKLLSTEVGSNTYSYSYDVRGNMIEILHLSEMNWNTQNELKSILKGSEPTYYQYSGGERVRKHTVKGNINEDRIYLGNFEIYRKFERGSLKIERQTVHVNDDTGRIAMLEVRTVGTDPSPASLQRYIYSNHLQSASLELDGSGEIISYEEYHPYGTTSYQANNANIKAVVKRYRYTGKERDEESGLYYHGARYYVPWLARWTAVDPLENKYAGMSSYNYGFNNPILYNDPSGADPGDGDDPKPKVERKPIPYPSNQVDNARDVRGEGAIRLLQKQEATAKNQAIAKQEQMFHNMYQNQRYIGEDQKGNFYNTSRRDITLQEYMMNEAWGEAIRGGPVAALGSLLDGREGAMKGSVVDAVMMSFSSPGTPYGKVEPRKPIEIKSVPIIEAPLQQARFSNKYVRTWYDIKVNSLTRKIHKKLV